MKYFKVFISGFLSGLFIAFGGLGFVLCKYYLGNAGQIAGAIVFPFGLYTICMFQLHLFTGKVGLVFEDRAVIADRAIDLPIMILGNFLGAAFFGYSGYLMFRNNTDLMILISNMCYGKCEANGWMTFLKANFCGMHVFLGVYFYRIGKTSLEKFLGCFIPIFFFVLFAYEHCVANTFYFSFANYWNWRAVLNIAIGIVGNSTGAWILWGLFQIVEGKLNFKKKENNNNNNMVS